MVFIRQIIQNVVRTSYLVSVAVPRTSWPCQRLRLNPKYDMHRGVCLTKQSIQNYLRMPYLVAIAFPSTGHPDPIRGYAIHGFADRDTNKVLIDQ